MELGTAIYEAGFIQSSKKDWWIVLGKFFDVDLKNASVNESHIKNRTGSNTLFLDSLVDALNGLIDKSL